MQQTARAAVLTAPKTFEIREYPIPAIGDDEMLIKVEACGVCGTDGHEYNRDPFSLCPVVLGHEGTGEIVAMGRNITKDTAGNPVALGDKIVTCIIPCGTCDACLNTPARTNLCENVGVYGLMPDDDVHLNGYFGEYLVIRKGSTFFNVSGMTLDQRILVEPAAVVVHSLERAKSTGLLKFNSVVLVQGCGPIGLLQIATLRTLGIETIIAVDGNDSRLELAREMGASRTYNFTRYADLNELLDAVKRTTAAAGGLRLSVHGRRQGRGQRLEVREARRRPVRSGLFHGWRGKRYQPPLRPLQQGGDRRRLLGVLPAGLPDHIRLSEASLRHRPAADQADLPPLQAG